jgi:prevent-host-death family protein
MTRVSAAEANRSFSKILRRAQAGESFIVTSRGKPVAKIEPIVEDQEAKKAEGARRQKLWEELEARLLSQEPMNLGKFNRDWAYDDDE